MELSFHSAQSFVEPPQLHQRSHAEQARHSFLRQVAVLRTLVLFDAILVPFSFLLDFEFHWSKLLSVRREFSFAASLLDWVPVSWLRDFLVLVLILRDATELEHARRYTILRSVTIVAFLYGVGRCCVLDWHWQRNSFWKVDPTVVLSSLMTTAIAVSAHMVFKSFRRMSVIVATSIGDRGEIKRHDFKDDISIETSSGSTGLPSSSRPSDSSKHLATNGYFKTVRIMKPYFWPSSGEGKTVVCNRVRAVSTWFCVAGSKCAILLSPLFLARATNAVSAQLESGKIWPTTEVVSNVIVYAALIFLSKAMKEIQSLLYIKVQRAAYTELADKTFVHLHSLSLEWHLRKRMGAVVRSMDRGIHAAQQVMQYAFLYLFPTLAECLAVGIIFIYHFNNFRLALILLASLILYCLVTVKLTLWRKKFRAAAAEHDTELHELLIDSLVNFETVKYFTAENYERQEFQKIVQKFQGMSSTSQASLSLLNLAQQFIMNLTLAGCMILACMQIFEDGGNLGTIYNMVTDAVVDMKAFGELLSETPDITDMPHAEALDVESHRSCAMVEFRNVFFNYSCQSQDRSLTDVCLTIPRGRTAALVGRTGSGKTTITRLLYRFYDPTSGQVLVNGQDTRSVTQRSLRQVLGIVPQDVVMFNASIAHNIRYGDIANCTQEAMEEVANKAQLEDFIKQQASGYDTLVGERGLKLSGGEKQRLAIARCLMKNPSIVILDEATSALDSQTEQQIQQALDVLSASRTVLAIAHRLSSVRHYDEIHVLEQGRVVEHGKHDELMAIGKIYAGMWTSQESGPSNVPDVANSMVPSAEISDFQKKKRIDQRRSTCPITGQVGACPVSQRRED